MGNRNFDVNAYWLERGKTYSSEQRLFTDAYRRQEDFILERLTSTEVPMRHVLEIGCGFGRLTKRIAEAFPESRITAVDLSPDQLRAAQTYCAEYADRISFHQYDIYSGAPFPGDHFDTAVAIEVFMHHPIEPLRALTNVIAAAADNLVTIDWSEEWSGPVARHVWLHDYESLYRSAGFENVRAFVSPVKMDGNQQKLFVATKRVDRLAPRPGGRLVVVASPLVNRIRGAFRVERARSNGIGPASRPLVNEIPGASLTDEPAADVLPIPGDRVVLVTATFPKFSETFTVDRFRALARQGWDVHVAAPKSDESQFAFFPDLKTDNDLRGRLRISPNIGETFRTLNPKLIHFEFGSLAREFIPLTRSIQARTIVSFRGFDLCHLGLDDPSFYSPVWQEADAIHLVSISLWRHARARGCPASKRHFIIHDAADEEFFAAEARTYRDRLGIPERPVRVLSVGRLVWQKGYEYALQAMARLAEEGISFEYRIIGEGDQRSAVLYTMHDLGIEHSVTLLGALPKQRVKDEMLRADLFLQASITEGFGVSVAEAQATGLPVVCSDADGLVENVADGMTGFVVPRRDPAAMAEKLRVLVRDRALRQRMGEAGRERAVAKFRLRDQLLQIEEMYRLVLDRRYQARQLSRELLAEGRPSYPRSPERIWAQEVALGD